MIIDAHVHLVTMPMVISARKRYDRVRPKVADSAVASGKTFMTSGFLKFLETQTVHSLAGEWISQMDKFGIDRAFFLPIGEEHDDLIEFVALHPDRFTGYIFLDDPACESAPEKLKKLMETGRFGGLKLYPSIAQVSVADKRMFPLYEQAVKLKIPVLIHFGISNAPMADYRYTNPIDLQFPAKIFPELNFVIAHFGAGYFRELLMLGFCASNIYVDTSGTNNWRLYIPSPPALKEVFKRTIETFGANRIIYGTDSVLNHKAGYRDNVLKEQTAVLSSLKLKKKEREKIMSQNAAGLFSASGVL